MRIPLIIAVFDNTGSLRCVLAAFGVIGVSIQPVFRLQQVYVNELIPNVSDPWLDLFREDEKFTLPARSLDDVFLEASAQ